LGLSFLFVLFFWSKQKKRTLLINSLSFKKPESKWGTDIDSKIASIFEKESLGLHFERSP
jgi:hypothetical protein